MATTQQQTILADLFENDPGKIDDMLHVSMMHGDFNAAIYIADNYAGVLEPATLRAFEEVRPMIQILKLMESQGNQVPEGETVH